MRSAVCSVVAAVLLLAAPAAAQQCAAPAPARAPEPAWEELRAFADGTGVRVAVIDTGVARHPELARVTPGKDFVNPEEPDPLRDCDGHGTVVAGIIAGRTAGLAPGAEIIAIKQSSATARREPMGNMATLTDAINEAVDQRAHVINISLVSCVDAGVTPDTRELEKAVNRAEESGAVVVAAAGNASAECPEGSVVYPAIFPTVVSVGAREDDHTMAQYSLPGSTLSAPGTVPVGLSFSGSGWAAGVAGPHGAVRSFTGTSFAAPVVTGTAALLKQRYPQASPAEIRQRLESAADPNGGALDPLAALTQTELEEASHHTVAVEPAAMEHSPAAQRRRQAGLVLVLAAAALALAYGARRQVSD